MPIPKRPREIPASSTGQRKLPKPPQAPISSPPMAPTSPPQKASKPAVPEGYAVDPVTGKQYKLLPAAAPEAVRAHKNNPKGMGLDEFMRYTKADESFDMDDLNGAAELFLPHLRVPPDKEEQKRILAARKARERSGAEEYSRYTSSMGTDEPESF